MARDNQKATKGKKKKEEKKDKVGHTPGPTPRLLLEYKERVIPALQEKFGIKNAMRVPRLQKIIINAGLGRSTQNIKIIEVAMNDLEKITGQKPVSTKSKLAISNFKLRKGLPVGVMVTLRGRTMWEFFDRLVNFALPRIRDFRGISDRGFDGRGNFTMGLKEQTVFPEISYDSADNIFGMNITMVFSTDSNDESKEFLLQYGFPFKKKGGAKQAA